MSILIGLILLAALVGLVVFLIRKHRLAAVMAALEGKPQAPSSAPPPSAPAAGNETAPK